MAEASRSFEPSTRVILWTHARSRSTVFELAMASEKVIHVMHEPYVMAYYFGEEREILPSLRQGPSLPGYKYAEVQAMLEKPFPGKAAIFVKDNFLGGNGRHRYIPNGYVNTFLVRNPSASVLSSFRVAKQFMAQIPSFGLDSAISWCVDTCGLRTIYDLYKYVTEELKQRPIVVHSEDLATSPEETLRKYCDATGLPFSESFVKWEAGNTDPFLHAMKTPEFTEVFYKRAVESSCFQPSSDSSVDLTDLPEKLRQSIDDYIPMYEEMISNKL